VKGALQVIVHDFAEAELDAAMRALIHRAVDVAAVVAPKNHFLAHAGRADGSPFHLVRFKQNVPLITYHENLLLN
jgi:hypothetical protein